ncbi:MAG TPA: hypothetical protein VMY78_09105 [Solirubrobacteraceae bacterium]|nr:hypothetical protein [Solirubrobacteraceae bacterium]
MNRGSADGVGAGTEISVGNMIPELTVTAEGLHCHPFGADLSSSPAMLVVADHVTLAEAKRLVTQRFLELRLADGTLPQLFQCAI